MGTVRLFITHAKLTRWVGTFALEPYIRSSGLVTPTMSALPGGGPSLGGRMLHVASRVEGGWRALSRKHVSQELGRKDNGLSVRRAIGTSNFRPLVL